MIKYISVRCQIMANSQVGTNSDHISFIISHIYYIGKCKKCDYHHQSSSLDHFHFYIIMPNNNASNDKGFHVSSQFTEVII